MGFLNKAHTTKKVITGEHARIYIEIDGGQRSKSFSIKISAESSLHDIEVKRIYLEVRGREEIEIPDTEVLYDKGSVVERRRETIHASHTTVASEYPVEDSVTLKAGQQHEWVLDITLPKSAEPTYHGRYCQHRYVARAILDCYGDKPNSGWRELIVE
ncbi:hypothetical protein [Pleionea sp. CnH1-48]|uniref:hypothetical protein n=1 Tax=Pleionea sp. CnH1-48 TaxID=2954494 RepID=UPI0020978A32|nr:hypothetical protein [Pleionea sp. CnH1-48]MCO7225644.1 hypothetical protein [Pleionea sp. CnH1-48]